MSLIYLASPYSHKEAIVRQQRYDAVMQITADFISRGFHVFSPIAYVHSMVEHLMSTKSETKFTDYYLFENGQKFDTDIIRRCDAFWILMLDGWRESIGIAEESKLARKLNLTFSFISKFGDIKSTIEDVERLHERYENK